MTWHQRHWLPTMFSRNRMRTAPTVGWLLGNSFVALPVDILPDWCSQVACPEEDYEVELEFKQGYGMDYCEREGDAIGPLKAFWLIVCKDYKYCEITTS